MHEASDKLDPFADLADIVCFAGFGIDDIEHSSIGRALLHPVERAGVMIVKCALVVSVHIYPSGVADKGSPSGGLVKSVKTSVGCYQIQLTFGRAGHGNRIADAYYRGDPCCGSGQDIDGEQIFAAGCCAKGKHGIGFVVIGHIAYAVTNRFSDNNALPCLGINGGDLSVNGVHIHTAVVEFACKIALIDIDHVICDVGKIGNIKAYESSGYIIRFIKLIAEYRPFQVDIKHGDIAFSGKPSIVRYGRDGCCAYSDSGNKTILVYGCDIGIAAFP